jgi:hypothetical protein
MKHSVPDRRLPARRGMLIAEVQRVHPSPQTATQQTAPPPAAAPQKPLTVEDVDGFRGHGEVSKQSDYTTRRVTLQGIIRAGREVHRGPDGEAP